MGASSASRSTWRPGLPGFTIVGLGDASIREARERVRGALRNAGFVHPPRRITVNLAPADVPKTGSAADLAIAIGILIGSEQFAPRAGRAALIGEVSLGGEIRTVPGLLPMVAALARRRVRRVIVPADGAAEARLVDGLEIVPRGDRRRRGGCAPEAAARAAPTPGARRDGATSVVTPTAPAVPALAPGWRRRTSPTCVASSRRVARSRSRSPAATGS